MHITDPNREFVFSMKTDPEEIWLESVPNSASHWQNYTVFYFFLFLLFQPFTHVFLIYFNQLWRQYRNILQNQPKVTSESEIPSSSSSPKSSQIKPEDKYLDAYLKLESTPLSEERLNRLKYTHLIENTPLGNLIMCYDSSRESFLYYADHTIPYRFLEMTSRHYVIQNNCKAIHVNMQEELTEAEKRLEEKKRKTEEEAKEREEMINKTATATATADTNNPDSSAQQTKKNVFAKLKNYNTGTMRGPNALNQKSGAIANPNASGNRPVTTSVDTQEILVKERANRYSCEGRMANFSFLKKVEKKEVDKRYAMTFSDFKRLRMNTGN